MSNLLSLDLHVIEALTEKNNQTLAECKRCAVFCLGFFFSFIHNLPFLAITSVALGKICGSS